MKKFSKFFLGLASVALMASCSDDLGKEMGNPGLEDPDAAEASVYLGVSFRMPGMSQSRSFTDGDNSSNNKVEVGTDVENNVNSVLVVLADDTKSPDGIPNYGFIACAEVQKADLSMHNKTVYHAQAQFTKTKLSSYYDANGVVKGDVAVFLFVNPTGAISGAVKNATVGSTEWLDEVCEFDVTNSSHGLIWSAENGGSFLMSNVKVAWRQLPQNFSNWNLFNTTSSVFHLSENNPGVGIDNGAANRGPVKVERAAARMDFRDGSPESTDANTYHVVYVKDDSGVDDLNDPLIDIRLNRMALVNMNKKFYYLRRTSDNGLNAPKTTANGWAICGAEKPWFSNAEGELLSKSGNYVVDAIADLKLNGIETGFSTYFNYPFFNDNGKLNTNNISGGSSKWKESLISDVLGGNKDNWQNPSQGNQTGTYNVWTYLTENVIPPTAGGAFTNQVNGITTGVVFKGKMQGISLTPEQQSKVDAWNAMTEEEKENATEEVKKEAEKLIDRKELTDVINNVDKKTTAETTDPILYSYAGALYLRWTSIRSAAISAAFSYELTDNTFTPHWNRENPLYKAVFGTGGVPASDFTFTYEVLNENGSDTVEKTYTDDLAEDPASANAKWDTWNASGRHEGVFLDEFKNAAVNGSKITIYQSSTDNKDGWGYYCYYYYWNHHNDNGNPGVMGPMELAVVRNNVYKLAVTKISKLGHPRIPENDPDEPKPDTPDEKEDIYLTVDAQVLPWVVRVNDIEF